MKNAFGMLKNLTILIAEDDPVILEQNAQTLRVFFKDVFCAKDGLEALNMYEEERPNMMLIDAKMPKLDGVGLIQKVRFKDYETPIIILSAFCDRELLLKVANLSVDGYLVKPLKLEELMEACCKSILRTKFHKVDTIVSFDADLFYNTTTKELYYKGVRVDMGHKERALLDMLLRARGGVVSKEEISSSLYPLEEMSDSAFKNLLSRLRKKIGEEKIVNVKGAGWRLVL